MRFRHYGGALLAFALVLTCGPPAQADNYPAKDASGTTWSFCSKLWTGVQTPCHIMMGLFGSQPVALAVDGSGNLGVNIQSAALPSGAATAAKQDTGNGSLATIVTNTTGAATAARQDTGNASLGSIDTKLTSQATAALQASANTKLDQLHTDLTAPAAPAAAQATANSTLSQIQTNTAAGATAAAQATGNGSLATIAANSTGSDTRSGTSTITAADSATTTVSGQSGVTLVTGTPTANSAATWALTGQSAVSLTVSGTFVETAQIETSADGGATYAPATAKILGTGAATASVTGPGVFRVDVTGMTNIRLRAPSYTSGTLSAKLTSSNAAGLTQVLNPVRLLGADGLTAASVSNGLPTVDGQNPSNTNSLPCTLNSSTTTCGPFTPTAPDFHVSWAPSSFTAACQVERKTDGTNWAIETVSGAGSTTQMANWSFSAASQAISEDLSEPQQGVQYQIHCTTTPSGSAAVKFSH